MPGKSSYSEELIDLLKDLKKSSVKFVVCGGIAVILHGIDRNTYDLDLSVDLGKENLLKIISVAKKFNLVPRIPEPVENLLNEIKRKEWVEKKGALVYTFVSRNSPMQLDIFLNYPKSFEELSAKADRIKLDKMEILVSSVQDLIYAKGKIDKPREKDMFDIKELKKMKK